MVDCIGCARSFVAHADRPDSESWPDYCALCQIRISHQRQDEHDRRMIEARKILSDLDDDGDPYRDSFIGDRHEPKLVNLMWNVVQNKVDGDQWPPGNRRTSRPDPVIGSHWWGKLKWDGKDHPDAEDDASS